MGVGQLGGHVFWDTSLADGWCLKEGRDMTFNFATLNALRVSRTLYTVCQYMKAQPDGEYLIPRSLIEKAEADEVRRIAELGEGGDGCLVPGCVQPDVQPVSGVRACGYHRGLFQTWDDVVA